MTRTIKVSTQTKNQIQSLVGLRLLFGVLVRIGGVSMSSIRPVTEIEKQLAIWPASMPVSTWLYRVLLAPFARWDALLYADIIERGYQIGNGLIQFHPLYPLTARLLWWLGFDPITSLQLISLLASIVFLYVLYKLTALDMSSNRALQVVVLFLCSTFSFAMFIPYSEALFMFCSVAAFLFARNRRWWLSGLMGALATLTRQQGIFLFVPLVWELFETYDRSLKSALHAFALRFNDDNAESGYALLMIPGAYLCWIFYRAFVVSDVHLDLSSINAIIYSVLISPNASQVVNDQAFVAPWTALVNGVYKLVTAPDIDIVINLVWAAYFLALVIVAWEKLRVSYKLYTASILLVSFMYTTGSLHPYMGLVRHLMLAFPVFIGLNAKIRRSWVRGVVLAVGMLGLLSTSMFYVLHVWVP